MNRQSLDERIDYILSEYKPDPFHREKELKLLLKEAEKRVELHAIGKINLYLAICIFQQGKRDDMLGHAYKAVSILEKLNDPTMLVKSYNMLGIAYAGLGSFQSAITCYNKALRLVSRKRNTSIRRETLMNNIGDSYFQMGAFQKSLRIAQGCLAACRRKNPDNHRSLVLYSSNCADSFCSLGRFDQAKEVLDSVREDVKLLDSKIVLCGYYTRRAYVLYALGDLEGGAENADKMLEIARENGDSYEFHFYYEQIAAIQIKNGDMDRAKRISATLSHYAMENHHSQDQITDKRVQALLCGASGSCDSALTLYKEIAALFEELLKEKRAIQYESQKSVDMARTEIGKLMQKFRAAEELADRDALTGLLNRSALVKLSTEFIQTAKQDGRMLGSVFLDIDYFKEYNDTDGHAAGDEAIKLIANICLAEENQAVKFFRYGGDEYFGIVLGCGDKELEALALRIYGKVRSSGVGHVKNPNGQRLTVSIGIVNLDLGETDATILDVSKYADAALYHAKNCGKDAVFAYIPCPAAEHAYKRVSPEAFDGISSR